MRSITLKCTIAFIAFAIGIAGTAIWFFDSFSNRNFEAMQVIADVPPIRTGDDNEERYAVYSALINELFLKDKSLVNCLNISDETSSVDVFGYLENTPYEQRMRNLKQMFPTVDEKILIDFQAKRLIGIKLQPNFNIPVQYNLINEDKAKKKKDFGFTVRIKFSQIAFNAAYTQAFVEVDYFCPMCGFGKHVLLEKQNEVWIIKEEFDGWSS
jgi:hypothetical protein